MRSTSVLSATALLCLALPFTGCKSSQPAPISNTTPAPGAAPSQTTTPDQSAAAAPSSAPGTVPSATPVAPAAANTAPMTPAPAPAALVVPAGTRATIRLNQTLSALHNDVGQEFTGELSTPIVVRGVTAFPRGTHVAGTIVAAKGKGRFKGAGDLAIELTQIGGARVHTSEYEAVGKGRGKRTAGFIGGGAGVGALIGGLAGGGKGALIGGLAGAGGGTAASAYTGNRDVVISAESAITFRLTAPVTVR